MSALAQRAQEHWKTFRPTAYAAIEDPTTFFANLAEEAQEQIDALTEATAEGMLVQAPGPETFAETQSRMVQARHAAEGQVLREMVLLPEETPDPTLQDSPEDREYEDAVREFQTLRDSLPQP